MMAVYLPCCSRFVTADDKQETRLREIAVDTDIPYLNFPKLDNKALLGIADQLWKPARHLHENLHRFQIA
jgi:hypothetical protein